eukprot:366357-Chlamydomonas_euryale.AAC.6
MQAFGWPVVRRGVARLLYLAPRVLRPPSGRTPPPRHAAAAQPSSAHVGTYLYQQGNSVERAPRAAAGVHSSAAPAVPARLALQLLQLRRRSDESQPACSVVAWAPPHPPWSTHNRGNVDGSCAAPGSDGNGADVLRVALEGHRPPRH